MKCIKQFYFLGLTIVLLTLACSSEKKSAANDTLMVDTVNMDTMATDNTAKDTVKTIYKNQNAPIRKN